MALEVGARSTAPPARWRRRPRAPTRSCWPPRCPRSRASRAAPWRRAARRLPGHRPRLGQGGAARGRCRPAERERFIGGHPVCGAERTGVAFARARPLPRRHLVPHARRPRRARSCSSGCTAWSARSGRGRWRSTPASHDRLMALVSHLPHVLAGALVNQAAATAPEGREALRSAGPVVRRPHPGRGLEPAALGRHPARQPRGGARGAARLRRPPRRRRGGAASAATATGCSASSARPPAPRAPPARRRGRRPGRARARGGGRPEPAGRRSPRSPPPSGTPTSTSRTCTCGPGPPDGEGELELVVDGPEAAREAVRLVGERGYARLEA